MRHNRGNVAVIFGLSAMTLVVAAGGGTDVVRQMDVRSKMQDAADAAVLRAVISSKMTDEEREIAADQAFTTNFPQHDYYGAEGTVGKQVIGNTTHVTYTATATVENLFLQMIGLDTTEVTIVAKAQSQMKKSEIALVLDTTGSMDKDNRMVNLKSSVDSVLASMLTDGTNISDTKVAIVPFNTQVRIDKGVSYTYIDYGLANSNSEGCTSSPGNGNLCGFYTDVFGKVCYQSGNIPSDPAACKTTTKFYYKSYSSGGKNYYDIKAIASGGGKTYSYTNTVVVGSKTTTTSPGCSTNSETGVETCSQGGTSTSTTYTLHDQNGTTTGTPSTTGFTYAGDKALIKYTVSTSNGYGAAPAPAASVSNGLSSTGNGNKTNIKKVIYAPATPDQKASWTGCITDRIRDFDVSATPYTSANPDTIYKAVSCANNNLGVIKGLATDIAAARLHVKNLKTGGNTNITIGIQWGMEVLSPAEPFTSTVNFKDDVTLKYMIVVTDGLNTGSRWYSKAADIDVRTGKACQAAKDQGITVFVVRVMEGNTELLKKCATKEDYFYDLSSATELNTALASVFEAIKKTRLTQ